MEKKNNDCKRPYVCPVCKGRGFVPEGFYLPLQGPEERKSMTTNNIGREVCRTCNGTGIVWG